MKAHINLADKKIRPLYFPSLEKVRNFLFPPSPKSLSQFPYLKSFPNISSLPPDLILKFYRLRKFRSFPKIFPPQSEYNPPPVDLEMRIKAEYGSPNEGGKKKKKRRKEKKGWNTLK